LCLRQTSPSLEFAQPSAHLALLSQYKSDAKSDARAVLVLAWKDAAGLKGVVLPVTRVRPVLFGVALQPTARNVNFFYNGDWNAQIVAPWWRFGWFVDTAQSEFELYRP
jgi:hypothetical protein